MARKSGNAPRQPKSGRAEAPRGKHPGGTRKDKPASRKFGERSAAAISKSPPRPSQSGAGAGKTGSGSARNYRTGTARPGGPARDSWQEVAGWWDSQVLDPDSHQQQVILPNIDALLRRLKPGRLLDVGCGQGFFSRHFAAQGWSVTGVDIAPAMIKRARAAGTHADLQFVVDDACSLKQLAGLPPFDLGTSIMQLMNVEDAGAELQAIARVLRKGGQLIGVILHPAFRIPRQSHWGWDEENKIQYRRMNRYLSPLPIPITMHPGRDDSPQTMTWHRPLSWYLNLLADAGLHLQYTEEWCSRRRSNSGPRAKSENLAEEEFPLFFVWVARKG